MGLIGSLALGALAVGLLSAPAWVLAGRLGLERPTLRAMAAALLAWAALVLLAQGLSLFDAFAPRPLLGAEAVLCLLVLAVLRPPRPRRPDLRALAARARALGPDYALLIALVGAGAAINLVLVLFVAPNNATGFAYHLSRAAYWAQEGSVFHFEGASVRQAAFPPNVELLMSWLITVSGRDVLVQGVQLLSYGLTAAAVYEGARLLRYDGRASLLAALLFALLPQPLLQASTAQNDLGAAFPIVAATVFGVRWLRGGGRPELLLAAAAVGLALGAKVTALVALPGLVVLLGLAARRASASRRAVALAGGALLAAGLLASANYVENQRDFGNPLAPHSYLERAGGGATFPREVVPRQSELPENVVRTAWSSFLETTPFHSPRLAELLQAAGRGLLPWAATTGVPAQLPELGFKHEVAFEIDEDTTGYGLLGLLVLLPALCRAILRGPVDRRALALTTLAGAALLAVTLRYSAFNGRLLLPFVALASPLMAGYASRRWARAAVTVLAAAGAVPLLLANPAKPVLPYSGSTVFGLDRAEQMSRRNPDQLASLRAVERLVPEGAPLGVRSTDGSLDYPLFGPRFEREVLRVAPGRDDERRGLVAGRRVHAIVYDVIRPPRGVTSMKVSQNTRIVFTARLRR